MENGHRKVFESHGKPLSVFCVHLYDIKLLYSIVSCVLCCVVCIESPFH